MPCTVVANSWKVKACPVCSSILRTPHSAGQSPCSQKEGWTRSGSMFVLIVNTFGSLVLGIYFVSILSGTGKHVVGHEAISREDWGW